MPVAAPTPVALNSQLTCLKGVGAQLAARFEKLGIFTLQDLLFHLPFRYIDRTRLTPLAKLQAYQHVVVQAQVQSTRIVFGKRRSLVCNISDGTGTVSLRFFHFSGAQKNAMANGATMRCFGEVRLGATGLEMYHPEYQILKDANTPLEQQFTPVYSVTEGVTQGRLRTLLEQAFVLLKNSKDLKDLLPNRSHNEPPVTLLDRLYFLHFPPADTDVQILSAGDHPYQIDLIREELTAYQISLLRNKLQRYQQQAPPLARTDLAQQFVDALPFEMTQAQRKVCAEIGADLSRAQPMLRLLQGDVGSGKTVVAAWAALCAIASNKQVALMVPTDILMEQHLENFSEWFAPLGIKLASLSGKQKVAERRQQLAAIHSGEAKMVLGTHALFQDSVTFSSLGLVIIDEQHRFGVHQRLQLRDKGKDTQEVPHQLIMTATPIPRTLAMSAYADLDVSVIDQMPTGRIPIQTVVISQQRREEVIERVRQACLDGKQVYWVCTLIEQSETLSAEAAEQTESLLKESMPELTIALVHGRLKPKEKQSIMNGFASAKIQLLVATTVIEVGVNVPNASLMIIENPERLGLAQLHQLRGRVGRGNVASHCVLLYGEPLSQHGKTRLQAMRETNDGFRIAEIDLEIRGPGEVLGTRQTGDIEFKLADLQRDLHLLPDARSLAEKLLHDEPQRASQLVARWVGISEQFAAV